MIYCYTIDQSIIQSSSEIFLLTVDNNEQKGLWLVSVHRIRNFGVLRPYGTSRSLSTRFGNLHGRGEGNKIVKARGSRWLYLERKINSKTLHHIVSTLWNSFLFIRNSKKGRSSKLEKTEMTKLQKHKHLLRMCVKILTHQPMSCQHMQWFLVTSNSIDWQHSG